MHGACPQTSLDVSAFGAYEKFILVRKIPRYAPAERTVLHSCCDYLKVHCNCLTCVENTLIADEMEDVSLEAQSDVQSTSLSRYVTSQRKNAIRADLEDYSISLHFGKSCVGGVTINRL